MKRIPTILTIVAVVALATAAFGAIAPRTVLVETFTNVSCAGCAPANTVTKQYMDDHGTDEVVNVQYHVNWPHPADPYYLPAPTDITGRAMAYMIANAPDLITDGVNTPSPADYAAMDAAVQARLALASTVRLDVSQTRVGLDVDVDVSVEAVGPVDGSQLKLRVALVEVWDETVPAPGSNGETEFHNTVRGMLPDHDGTTIVIAEGQTVSHQFSTTLDAAWADTDIEVVAWLQDDATREVLQTATTIPADPYAAAFYAERFGAVTPAGVLTPLDSYLENTGSSADTYDVVLTKSVPAGWSVSACAGAVCYPPWITSFSVTLQPGESVHLALDVTPDTGPSEGVMTLTATSQGDPSLVLSHDFAALAPGTDVLFVDADGGYAYEAYFTDALTTAGATHQTWDRAALGHLTIDDLAHYPAVVWNADLISPALQDVDMDVLTAYLDQQGDLLLSGQDIAFHLANPSSPYHTPESQAWYEDVTGASFDSDDSHDTGLVGVTGDPIGDGHLFNIAGGSGANNQGYPDVLIPAANARAVLEYSPGEAAAVRYLRNEAHIVTLGFGFEGIDTAAHRTDFMADVLAWFAVNGPTGVDQTPGLVALSRVTASPNPFNPSTEVAFALGEGALVRVDVHDLQGRLVRSLWNGRLEAGAHALPWNGRDSGGATVASGAYLARVRTGDDVRTVKLLLAK